MRRSISWTFLAAMAVTMPVAASAEVRITEFLFQGAYAGNREFVELTNLGDTAVDVTGWSYNDNNPNNPVTFGNFFGSFAPHESVILTELTASAFQTYWGLDPSVRIFSIGGNSNLGDGDTINIYNSTTQNASTLVDSLLYAAGLTPGVSRNRPLGVQGAVTNDQFVYSSTGDTYGSALAPNTPADLGNPGRFAAAAAVPEPAGWAMMTAGLGLVGANLRRRRATVRRLA